MEALLKTLSARGIELWLQNNELHYKAPKFTLDDKTRGEIKRNKADIIAYLKREDLFLDNNDGGQNTGASAAAIQAHYDTGNDFYQLWLDPSLTYSCALFSEEDIASGETLNEESFALSQLKKIDYHAEQARVKADMRVLDIGCGWGSMLSRLVAKYQVAQAVGLTLSRAQWQYIQQLKLPRASVCLESWPNHVGDGVYDAIVSIGAMEHFVKPNTPSEKRLLAYKSFFSHCRRLLKPGGFLSLQTMAYNIGQFHAGALATIFPESDLPKLSELVEAADDDFTIVQLRNDPSHYSLTVKHWQEKFLRNRERLVDLVGQDRVKQYERFFTEGIWAYDNGIFNLFRITFQSNETQVLTSLDKLDSQ